MPKSKSTSICFMDFRKHLCGLTYIDTTIHTNMRRAQHTTITHMQTHLHRNNHTYTSKCLHTYIYNYINNKHRSNIFIHIKMCIFIIKIMSNRNKKK